MCNYWEVISHELRMKFLNNFHPHSKGKEKGGTLGLGLYAFFDILKGECFGFKDFECLAKVDFECRMEESLL